MVILPRVGVDFEVWWWSGGCRMNVVVMFICAAVMFIGVVVVFLKNHQFGFMVDHLFMFYGVCSSK